MNRIQKLLVSFFISLLLMLTITGTILAQDSRECTETTRCTDTSQSENPDDITTKPPCSELEPEGNEPGATDPDDVTTTSGGRDTQTASSTVEDSDGDCVGTPDDITTGD